MSDRALVGAERITERVGELAEQIGSDYASEAVVLAVVLKGAVVFASDLLRRMRPSTELEFVRAKSYAGTESTGRVDVSLWPERRLDGKHVVVVEDILDTGRTTAAVLEGLRARNPASLRLCVLLDKPSRRVVPVSADYIGFVIEDLFVVGYGLDFEERFRGLPDIRVLE